MHLSIKQDVVQLQDFYSRALDQHTDLTRAVKLVSPCEIIEAASMEATHNSYHQVMMFVYFVFFFAKVNLLSGNYLIKNIPKRPSSDTIIVHLRDTKVELLIEHL